MKDPRGITTKIQNALTEKGRTATAVHSYVRVLALKVSPQVPAPLSTKKKDLSNTTPISKGWKSDATQTAVYSSHLGSKTPAGAYLVPERVRRWKDPSSVINKMRRPCGAAKLPENISLMDGSQERKVRIEEEKQDELWRDLMKNQEERHFRIGRITNFFT